MKLRLLSEPYSVFKLGAWPTALEPVGELFSLTRTGDEVSLVAPSSVVVSAMSVEAGWRCFRVVGVLDFSLKGVLVSILTPLMESDVSVFVVSTYDTDYVLVREAVLSDSVHALTRAGFEFVA